MLANVFTCSVSLIISIEIIQKCYYSLGKSDDPKSIKTVHSANSELESSRSSFTFGRLGTPTSQ